MDMTALRNKWLKILKKYKYVIVVIAVGLLLMLIPTKASIAEETISPTTAKTEDREDEAKNLSAILSKIKGAGEVTVYLTISEGETTVYQTDSDLTADTSRTQTIVVSDTQRNEVGLVVQVNPPTYKGAIVVCEGADNPSVRLSITDAVSKVTGLGANRISVMKMK